MYNHTTQVYVGEIYGNVEPDQGMNENLPFDYMGLVKNLKQPSSDGGTLTLQVLLNLSLKLSFHVKFYVTIHVLSYLYICHMLLLL